MTVLGFTGTQRGMTDAQRRGFIDVIDRFVDRDQFHHGSCIGADEQAHHIAISHGWYVHVHPPTNASKEARLIGHVTYSALPYLARNQAIVAAEHLVAAPAAPEDHPSQRRSGTWYTVRRARLRGIPVTVVWPDWARRGEPKMTFVHFLGCTSYEIQLGRLWVRLLRPRFWRTSWPSLIDYGWDRSDAE